MAKSFAGLKADALTIKNETEESKNTAARIGTMFTDVIDKIEEEGSDAVRYSAQSASEAQKKQARENLGAAKKLVSGENIKTINGENVLGSGDISTSIDVSALFTVGGTMQVGGIDLLTHHLYVRTENYISNVSVVVGNREYILEARRRDSLSNYNTVWVKAVVSIADGVATCMNVILG